MTLFTVTPISFFFFFSVSSLQLTSIYFCLLLAPHCEVHFLGQGRNLYLNSAQLGWLPCARSNEYIHRKYEVNVDSLPLAISESNATAVSNVQHLATFLIVYPPPPSTSSGRLNFLTKLTHCAWPATKVKWILNQVQWIQNSFNGVGMNYKWNVIKWLKWKKIKGNHFSTLNQLVCHYARAYHIIKIWLNNNIDVLLI